VLLADLPDVLTIDEAAAVLRISRGAAYQLAHEYLWSGGREGLPVFRLGRRLRVPKVAIERLLASEPSRASELPAAEPGPWPGRLRSV
jgi:excisionase family DNA binding protein